MHDPAQLTWLDLAVLVAYLLIAVAIGLGLARRERSTRDYFRASGRVPWWAAGLSLYGTKLSTLTFIGIPALVAKTNWSYFLGMVAAVAAVPLVRWLFLPLYRRLDITTAYAYLEQRFHRSVRLLGSGTFIVFHLGRAAILMVLPALALAEVTTLTIYTSIALMGVFSLIYTMLGGIEAVVWTDVMQVVVLVGGAFTAALIAVLSLDGGFSQFFEVAGDNQKFALINPGWGADRATAWVIFLGYGLSQFNLYISDQTLVQRYLTTRDERAAGRALWLNVLGALPIQVLFYTLGTAMFVFYASRPEMKPDVSTDDALVPVFLLQQLPIGLSGLVIAGIFAAGMSTIDSSMNSIATAVVSDFYRPTTTTRDDLRRLALARWVTLAVGALAVGGAMFVAAQGFDLLLNRFLDWLGMVMGVLGGVFVLGVLTTRTHWVGALTGLIVGALAVAVVRLAGVEAIVALIPESWPAVRSWVSTLGALHFFLYSWVGMIGCVAAGYGVSRLVPINQPGLAGLTWHTRRSA